MSEKPGWEGRYYEDFEVGDVYPHRLGRTVTENDNIWFTMMTMNTNMIHFDANLAKNTPFGQPLMNSCFTLSLVTGISVTDLTQNGIANLSWTDIELPNPVFNGDTIYAQSEVLSKRESESRPYAGIVEVKTTGYKQDGTIVIEFKRTFMIYRRSHRTVNAPPRPVR